MRAELVSVIRKELRQIFRDPRLAVILVAAPVLQLVLLGYAVNLDVDHIETAVVNLDRTPASRALVDGLLADGTLQRDARHLVQGSDPSTLLEQGRAQTVLVVPRGLSADMQRGRAVQMQVLVDGTDPVRAQVAVNTAVEYLQGKSLALARERLTTLALQSGQRPSWPMIKLEPRILYNPRLKSPIYMIPGVAAVALLVVTTIVTAMGLAREKELGTIEQLLITPIHPLILLLGKILPVALIGLVTSGLVLAAGTHLFDVPIRGSLGAVFVGIVLYLMSTVGMGVFIGTVSRTQQQAILGGFFFLMPAMLLSGFMTPVENMPAWIQPITWINPVRYIVEILRASLLKGATFVDLARPLLALFIFGAAILGLSALRFRKQVG